MRKSTIASSSQTANSEEPTEFGPPCPKCGGQTVPDPDDRTRPVCLDCVTFSVPADAPPAARPLVARQGAEPVTGPMMTAYPPPPAVPAGATLTHLILYTWSDPPAPLAMARGPAGALLVCDWDHAADAWAGWKANAPE